MKVMTTELDPSLASATVYGWRCAVFSWFWVANMLKCWMLEELERFSGELIVVVIILIIIIIIINVIIIIGKNYW